MHKGTTMRNIKIYIMTLIPVALAFMAVLLIEPHDVSAASSHMERGVNAQGCSACHSGRGVGKGGLLRAKREQLCFRCHGSNSKGKGRTASNIEETLSKFSRHPIEDTSQYHRATEQLPTRDSSDMRHVACEDCHLAHITSPNRAWNGIAGYMPMNARGLGKGSIPMGLRKKRAEFEHELCYRCHADGANVPLDSGDVSVEFDPENPSYHPVESTGRNKNVPSLLKGLTELSVINCSACHGNDEPGGAAGPHGSRYAPILRDEYRTEIGPESDLSYALCYSCHDRNSILADESFRAHKAHVTMYNIPGAKCHNAHGSRTYPYLIEFDLDIITNASDGTGPFYVEGVPGMPKCYLNCHGGDHTTSDINGNPWPW